MYIDVSALLAKVKRALQAVVLVAMGAAAGLQGMPEQAKVAISQSKETIDDYMKTEEAKAILNAPENALVQTQKKADRIEQTVETKVKAVGRKVDTVAKKASTAVRKAMDPIDRLGAKYGKTPPLPQAKPQPIRPKTNFGARELK
jgi:gas vesicle protein